MFKQMKFDTHSLILLLIAVMLGYTIYLTRIFVKLNLFQAGRGKVSREMIDAVDAHSSPSGKEVAS